MESFTLVIFGITSNLAQIKLIPALYDLEEKGALSKDSKIIGVARSPKTNEELCQYFHEVLHLKNRHHKHDIKENVFQNLCPRLHYLNGQLDNPGFYQRLNDHLKKTRTGKKQNLIFYLATYPDLYQPIFDNLKKVGLTQKQDGWVRLMVEKPIGLDLPSAKKLNKLLLRYFQESQIYRLDHYLGKETLQNILTFRFGNGVFEPLMKKEFIDHIQVTALEDFSIGKRGGYYDPVGALKDVGQNHLLQMLVFAVMDAPAEFSNEQITKRRLEILKRLVPFPEKLVLGQYQGYKKELSVSPNSQTDTYFAFKTEVNNKRFKGVPIYVRGGKLLDQTVTEISIVFKNPINRLFKHLECGEEPNVLIYRIQPNEGIVLKILTKKPAHDVELDTSMMQFCYRRDPSEHYLPDPYERLLLDAIREDQIFFNDSSEVEAEWKFIDAINSKPHKIHLYKPGSRGPKAADKLIEEDGRSWLEPSPLFCAI